MTEYPPDEDKNTAYKTRAEMEEDESLTGLLPTTHPTTNPTNTGARTSANAGNAVRSSHSVTKLRALLPTNATPSSRSPRVARYADTSRKGSGGIDLGEEQRSPSYFGPTKEVGSGQRLVHGIDSEIRLFLTLSSDGVIKKFFQSTLQFSPVNVQMTCSLGPETRLILYCAENYLNVVSSGKNHSIIKCAGLYQRLDGGFAVVITAEVV